MRYVADSYEMRLARVNFGPWEFGQTFSLHRQQKCTCSHLVLEKKKAWKLIIDSPAQLQKTNKQTKKICSECQDKAKKSVDSKLRLRTEDSSDDRFKQELLSHKER